MTKGFPVESAQQLGEYIRALRKERGYTQTELGRLLGVSAMRVATIEKDVGRLSTRSMIELLKLLGAKLEMQTDASSRSSSSTSSSRTPREGEW